MSFPDEDHPRRRAVSQLGEALADLSIEELHMRIADYHTEIRRLQVEIDNKEKSRKTAELFFRL